MGLGWLAVAWFGAGLEALFSLVAGASLAFGAMARAIKASGNYGESFERGLGHGSRVGLDRGLNDLWTRGGLMYALPLR